VEARKPTELRGGRAPGSEELESWIGWRVDDSKGSMLGHVESVIGDGEGGVAWLVVAEFRLGDGRRFIVPAFTPLGDRRLRADLVETPQRRVA
jgi:hypothetical protein